MACYGEEKTVFPMQNPALKERQSFLACILHWDDVLDLVCVDTGTDSERRTKCSSYKSGRIFRSGGTDAEKILLYIE